MAPLITTTTTMPQRHTTIAKVAILVLCALMGGGAFGMMIHRARIQRKLSSTYYLATPVRPGSSSSSSAKSKQGGDEQKDAARSAAADLSEDVAELLQERPLFGAIPKAGPPQASLQGILGDTALINGKWIKVGDTEGGVKLVQTMIGKVEVEIEGKRQVVSVFSDLPTKPFPAGPSSLMAGSSSDSSARGPRGRFARMREARLSSSSRSGADSLNDRDRALAKRLEKEYGDRISKLSDSDRRKLLGNYSSIPEAFAAYRRGEFKPPISDDQLQQLVGAMGSDDSGDGRGRKKSKKNRNMDDFGASSGVMSGSFSAPGAGSGSSGRRPDPETLARLRARRAEGAAPVPPPAAVGSPKVAKPVVSDPEREARRASRESGAGIGSASRSSLAPGSSGRPDRPSSALGSRSSAGAVAPVKAPPVKAPPVKVSPAVSAPRPPVPASRASAPPSALRERKAQSAAGLSSSGQKKPSVSGKSSADRPSSRKARNPYRN